MTRGANFRLTARQIQGITVSSWVTVSLFSALPFLLSSVQMDLTDSVFEPVSGITSTGSTVLTGLAQKPKSILLWRRLLQWVGGIGFVVMALAVLPSLRVGGMMKVASR